MHNGKKTKKEKGILGFMDLWFQTTLLSPKYMLMLLSSLYLEWKD